MQNEISVPHGNTAAQVNETAYQMLQPFWARSRKLLDLPCGEGEWLQFLQKKIPHLECEGADLASSATSFRFHPLDITQEKAPRGPFDIVTSISGIVCFGNHLRFFREVESVLAESGIFLLTHDNHWTLRDRIHYFFFGTFKRFPVLFREGEGNTQATTLMTILDSLEKAGFEWQQIIYTSVKPEDRIWIPLAAILWIFQWPLLRFSKSRYSRNQVRQMFPFRGLYARHFLIISKRKNDMKFRKTSSTSENRK